MYCSEEDDGLVTQFERVILEYRKEKVVNRKFKGRTPVARPRL
jgi:hypothetical protein